MTNFNDCACRNHLQADGASTMPSTVAKHGTGSGSSSSLYTASTASQLAHRAHKASIIAHSSAKGREKKFDEQPAYHTLQLTLSEDPVTDHTCMRIAAMPSADGTSGRNACGTVVAIATVIPARG